MEPNLEPNEPELPAIPQAHEWVIAVTASLPELALSAHPLVGLLGSLLGPALHTAYAVDKRSWALGGLRGGRALQVAASRRSESMEDLAKEIAVSDARTELAARVLDAAARTATLEDKVDALGRALAYGLKDDAKLDEALLIVAALRDCEKPHIRILDKIDRQPDPPHISPAPPTDAGWTHEQLGHEFPEYVPVLAHVVNTLSRHALIRDIAIGIWAGTEGTSRWLIAPLGSQILRMLRESGS